jgi:D-alanyl-D-alanine carboxypeptidase
LDVVSDEYSFDFEFTPPPRPRPPRRRRRRRSNRRPLLLLVLLLVAVGTIVLGAKALVGDDGGQPTAAANASTAAPETQPASTAKKKDKAKPKTQPVGIPKAQDAPKVTALPAPTYANGAKAMANQPSLGAIAWVALDVDRNEILLAHSETDTRPIASLTKMMTGLLTAEAGNLWHPVTVSATAADVEPNKDGLIIGNRYPRGILLYSAMLGSNNDAAAALGEDLGRGSYQRYYRMMNKRARELGLTATRYGSSSGLNDATNWSTARDQAILLARALGNPTFAQAVGTWRHTVRWPDTGKSRTYENHNKMLKTYPGTIGGKTGFTTLAGGCLAVAVKKGGRTIVAVVLHTNDVWADMPRLVDAAFKRAG